MAQQQGSGAFGRLKGMFTGQAQEDSARELMNEVISTLRRMEESDRDQIISKIEAIGVDFRNRLSDLSARVEKLEAKLDAAHPGVVGSPRHPGKERCNIDEVPSDEETASKGPKKTILDPEKGKLKSP